MAELKCTACPTSLLFFSRDRVRREFPRRFVEDEVEFSYERLKVRLYEEIVRERVRLPLEFPEDRIDTTVAAILPGDARKSARPLASLVS